MSIWKNLLGGLFGYAIGGPIGAIIGAVLGSAFGSSDNEQKIGSNQHSRQFNFHMSLLILLASVMKADGVVKKSELAVVKEHLRNLYPSEQDQLQALQMLQRILEVDYDIDEVTQQLAQEVKISSRRELLHILFEIAIADGIITDTERAMLYRIAVGMKMTSVDFRSIGATVDPGFDFQRYYNAYNGFSNSREDYNSGYSRSNSNSNYGYSGYADSNDKSASLDWAYNVLGIESTATDEEVRKAYRSMAKKYHPDLVNDMGEEVVKTATEKFKKVNEAYDAIKEVRKL